MNNIMLDLETLDTLPTAIVLSIGLVKFDPTDVNDPIKDKHYVVLSVGDQEENERTASDATIDWWEKQSKQAQTVLIEATAAEHDVHEQLMGISEWMGKDAIVWGNGSDFDNVILSDLYRTYELKQPWSHRNNRCFRTLCALVNMTVAVKHEGVHHNALDDAVHQARMAARYLQILKRGVGNATDQGILEESN